MNEKKREVNEKEGRREGEREKEKEKEKEKEGGGWLCLFDD